MCHYKQPFRERFDFDDRTPIKVTFNSIVYQKSRVVKTSLSSIKKMYIYINGGTSGWDKFKLHITNTYPQCCSGNHWNFDEEDVMREFNSIPKFKELLEVNCMDTIDKLYFWSNKGGTLCKIS